MRKAHKFLSLIVAAAMLLPFSIPVYATSASGTVKIGFFEAEDKIPQEGAVAELYQVADLVITDVGYKFSYTDDFKGCSANLSAISDDYTDIFADYIEENNISGEVRIVNNEGYADFGEVKLGLYLAVQTKATEGTAACNPFLITVPQGSLDSLNYDIIAVPKTDIVRLVDITVKKVWNDSEKKRPDSVSVQLLNNDKVVDEVTLSVENDWEYIWTEMPKGDGYSVREIVPKGYTATYKQNGFEFTVTNTDRLVQTGQLNWPVPVLAGMGLLLMILGLVIWQKDSSKNEK